MISLEELKKFFEEKGLTIKDLSEKSGLSQERLRDIFQGDVTPNESEMKTLSDLFERIRSGKDEIEEVVAVPVYDDDEKEEGIEPGSITILPPEEAVEEAEVFKEEEATEEEEETTEEEEEEEETTEEEEEETTEEEEETAEEEEETAEEEETVKPGEIEIEGPPSAEVEKIGDEKGDVFEEEFESKPESDGESSETETTDKGTLPKTSGTPEEEPTDTDKITSELVKKALSGIESWQKGINGRIEKVLELLNDKKIEIADMDKKVKRLEKDLSLFLKSLIKIFS